jgi:hypothetical protein
MSYDYQTQREHLFTEQGQVFFLAVRDNVKHLLRTAGAFRFDHIKISGGYDSWQLIAAVERLAELKEIVELPRECWTQFRVFTSPETHDY